MINNTENTPVITEKKCVYNGYLTIMETTISVPNVGNRNHEIVEKRDAVAAMVYNTVTGKYIFVKQFRPATNGHIIEAVAGTKEVGEDPEACMIREIKEEIGYEVDTIQFLGSYYSSPGFTTEKLYLYQCNVSTQSGTGGGLVEELEFIEIVEMDKTEVKNISFEDMKTMLLSSLI